LENQYDNPEITAKIVVNFQSNVFLKSPLKIVKKKMIKTPFRMIEMISTQISLNIEFESLNMRHQDRIVKKTYKKQAIEVK